MGGYKGINNTDVTGNLGYIPEDQAKKSTDSNLGNSDILYPSQRAVKLYVDLHSGGGGSNPAITTVSMNLGNEQSKAVLTISDPLADSNFLYSAFSNSEELRLQNVSFYIENIVNGVGYDLVAICPQMASGIFSVTIKREVVSVY